MVTSDGLTNVDSWLYRQGFNVDSWLLTDTFSHDNDLLARALHTTVTASATPLPSSFFDSVSHPVSSTHTTLSSNVSAGSDPEIIGGGGAKRKRNCLLGEGKATKRSRSRPSKKTHTTFITADPSNFRQMVQQVTGANYIVDDSSSFGIFAPILKPEPLRLVNKLPKCTSDRSTAVPMLDTSAFLSNHHQENLGVDNAFSGNIGLGLPSAKSNAVVDVSAVDFDTTNSIFPTLESWKVM
ncbi:PREDICTED: calmodulin-binding protein 25-like [Camelina sativa]|uniref:Calmodulin-binding protein 25-like n=1 Tax=Camelina sativa TaxID=90675 RepID=A0ABM0Z0M9_CAMSA|nr:PREDICTED: calmodulin-binding protein 25-like [Camelina sativa]